MFIIVYSYFRDSTVSFNSLISDSNFRKIIISFALMHIIKLSDLGWIVLDFSCIQLFFLVLSTIKRKKI